MATLYWGPTGGTATGTWDLTTTTNWYTDLARTIQSSAAPTSVDDVVFDAASNVGTGAFTVTIGASGAVCRSFSTGGAGGALDGTMTLAGSGAWSIFGSLSFPASNLTRTYTGVVTFASTSTGNTISTQGIQLTTANVNFNGVGGGWTLGSNFVTGSNIFLLAGALDTAGFSSTSTTIQSSGSSVCSLTLGSSTVTLSGATTGLFISNTNCTVSAGTSTINFTGSSGGGIATTTNLTTWYNVNFQAVGGRNSISGNNVFNNLTVTTPSAANGVYTLHLWNNITINGTFTAGSANTAVRRVNIFGVASNLLIPGVQQTITFSGASSSCATLADVDFRDVNIATANSSPVSLPLTGTRLGNCGNVSNITTATPKTVYWNLAGSQNWSATGWATTNNGTPAVNNFPLAQDTATFTEAGAAGTVTVNAAWNIGTIQMADGVSNRSTAMTLATSTSTPVIYGSVTFFSSLTLSGTGVITFSGQNVTQNITSAGKTWTQPLTIAAPTGTVQLQDNNTLGSTLTTTLTQGTLNLNGKTLSTGLFSSTNSNTRVIAFGAGNITTTGSGTVWNTGTVTGFSYTGTPTVNISNNSATATTVTTGALSESQALNFNYTVGTYTLTDTNSVYKNLNFAGFTGTVGNAARTIYGNLTIAAGSTLTAGANATTFAATSGTQQITTNGKTLDFPLTFNGIGGTFAFQDALTQGSTRAFTLTNGTLQLKNGVTSTVGAFATSGTNQKFLQSTSAGNQATISQASGTVNSSYLTIQDSNATGGATWLAYVDQQNVDNGNNDGWDFGISPVVGGAEYTYRLRSFTEMRQF